MMMHSMNFFWVVYRQKRLIKYLTDLLKKNLTIGRGDVCIKYFQGDTYVHISSARQH